ncbi:hypothetical protein E6C50_08155 [Flavobacterium supellecticarium]|uniref:Uncharacterized protein n=1 Tax=Flavobacterium supellecticarium TaxID=2565924 RepID=A0A4S4A097_9FLAO|nr:hypothetical protein [Flavobacterium supellecticarium]THF51724.1 hypothetical protein E6C50_08155 [Flavobacterium supellecticarium]
MELYFKIGIGFISLFILLALISLLLIFSDRTKLNDMTNKNHLGSFHGGTFYSQPLLPIDECEDENLNQVIKSHNKKIRVFYFSFLFLILGIVFLNLSDK